MLAAFRRPLPHRPVHRPPGRLPEHQWFSVHICLRLPLLGLSSTGFCCRHVNVSFSVTVNGNSMSLTVPHAVLHLPGTPIAALFAVFILTSECDTFSCATSFPASTSMSLGCVVGHTHTPFPSDQGCLEDRVCHSGSSRNFLIPFF